jgi:glycosyltransferase involved in cell wall biosynthesis
VVQLLSGELAGSGYDVTVGVVSVPGGGATAYTDLLRAEGVSVMQIGVGRRAYVSERRLVREWLRALAPDVLHTHGYRPDVIDAPVARRLGIATVVTFHGFSGTSLRERLYERLQVHAAGRADRVVAVSRPIRERLERSGVAAERIALIPNAFRGHPMPLGRHAARAALGIPDDRLVFGWVGRLTPEKGPDVALRAHALLSSPRPLLVVIGDGEDGQRLRELSLGLRSAADVLWLGAIPSADRYFRAFDGLVLSSRTEGAPIVVLEAAHAGVPIVATRVGEVAEMTGQHGALLVEPEQPSQLAAALALSISMPGHAAERAARARDRVARLFSAGPWAERHVRLYLDAICTVQQRP